MLDFAMLPPEINSARIYSGPGAGSLYEAAFAWDSLAAGLEDTAVSTASTVNTLVSSAWLGPSSLHMAAAALPYVSWLHLTAAHTSALGASAKAAGAAFETARLGSVPPPVIAANRAQLAALVATNLLGQNTAAIAATEAAYMEMWAQDAAAMTGYAASATAATATLTPPLPAPTVADPANSLLTFLFGPGGLGTLPGGLVGFLNGTGTGGLQGLGQLINQYSLAFISSAPTTNFTSVIALASLASLATLPYDLQQGQKDAASPSSAPLRLPSPRPFVGKGTAVPNSPVRPRLPGPVTGEMGTAAKQGPLSVPSGWKGEQVQSAALAEPLGEGEGLSRMGIPVLPFMPVAHTGGAKDKDKDKKRPAPNVPIVTMRPPEGG